MKLSNYIAQYLGDYGVCHIFMVTGGGAMHLNDAFGYEPRLTCIFNHHEQACAMAAEGYARITGKIGAINVTTGPGGINALNGVFGAWTDSIPMLIISGQVKQETCMAAYKISGLRQLGDQEADIISMVKGITKYARMVTDPASIRYHLERAIFLATSGRPGPCWLDIPMDVQAASVDPQGLRGYDPAEDVQPDPLDPIPSLCRDVLDRLQKAKRPVVMPGTGVRLSGSYELFREVAHKLGIPVSLTWTTIDLVANDDPLYCGRAGTIGDRAGNFTAQNADVLLVLGSRLNIRQISYNWKSFARQAFKIQVDADPAELIKPTLTPDLPICCDVRIFLEELNRQIDDHGYDATRHQKWLAWCRERVVKYSIHNPPQGELSGMINPYAFIEGLFQYLKSDDVIVCSNGSACVIPFQIAEIKKGMRVFGNSGCASMGYGLPAAIGVSVGREGRRVICIEGDGSIQMNIQELQTVAHHRWPIKIFILNNNGYLSIRQTQQGFFGRLVGESRDSGVSFPDMMKVAQAYDLPAYRIEKQDFPHLLPQILAEEGPCLCDVLVDPAQGFEPKLAAKVLPDGRIISPALEDMSPFLPHDELLDNLFIKEWKE